MYTFEIWKKWVRICYPLWFLFWRLGLHWVDGGKVVSVAAANVFFLLFTVLPPIAFILTLFLWEDLTNIWLKIGWFGAIGWSFFFAFAGFVDPIGSRWRKLENDLGNVNRFGRYFWRREWTTNGLFYKFLWTKWDNWFNKG